VAGLTFHSFVRVSRVDLGFDPSHLWQVALPSRPAGLDAEARRAERAARQADVERALERLREAPFVVAAGAADSAPMSQALFSAAIYVPGREGPLDVDPRTQLVSAGYLRALAPRVVEGRLPGERASTSDELLVNRAFARALGDNPEILKGELRLLSSRGRIVGVVDDFVGPAPGLPDSPRIFVSLGDGRASVLLVRLRGDEPQAVAAVRLIAAESWGPSMQSRVTPVSDDAAALAAPWRARTILLGLIAVLGVPMVVAGLTGSLYASVRRRTRDIAIRLALGATTRDVSRLIVWRALAHTGVGVALGLAAAMAIGRVLSGVLFGVTPTDPATLASVGVLMLAVAAVASLLPARLAASIAPIDALRER
jgi:hypothetical protein